MFTVRTPAATGVTAQSVCGCVCVRVCPKWVGRRGRVGGGREDETIVGLEPNRRPCAVYYHTAVHMRSKQKQHDSPPPPRPPTHPHTHPPPPNHPNPPPPPPPRTHTRINSDPVLSLPPRTRHHDYTERKERTAVRYSPQLPSVVGSPTLFFLWLFVLETTYRKNTLWPTQTR